MLDLMDDYRVL